MISMHEALVTTAALVVAVGVVFGAVAITTGRIIPGPESGRAKVLRPRVWGYGTLVFAVGIGMFIFLGPLQGPTGGYSRYALAGLVLSSLGLYVQRLAAKPGRTDATKTSS